MTTAEPYSIVILAFNAREWLSGGAPPCQGGGRGFDPRLALLFFKRYPMDTSFVILFPRRVSNPRGFDVSPTGSVVASATQRCPPDTRNPSRAFFDIFRSFLCLYIIYIWKILKLKHFPKKLIPYIKIVYLKKLFTSV